MSDTDIVIIADDHPLFRAALSDTLSRELNNVTLVEAADFNQLQSHAERYPNARLAVVDLHMPGAHGFSSLIFLTAHFPQIPVLMISANDSDDVVRRSADHGATGFLSKSSSADAIREAVNAVAKGQLCFPAHVDLSTSEVTDEESQIAVALASLTPQQFRVATMLSQGLLNKQIAHELDVTEATIKAHITEIFKKIGVHSRTQAALALGKLDLASPVGPDSDN
ncbi:MAG: DNA-binding response regulator [Gammaproteobacteria bacterium]|nr:MAG: DNA-binding response regulator [Gammaproteobacteria bacterium]